MIETPPAAGRVAQPSALSVLEKAFRAVEARDVQAILDLGTENAVFIDPHYPSQRMEGRAAIADGLRWAFANIRSFRFDVQHAYEGPEGTSAAVEVNSHHVLRGGIVLDYPQVFVIEVRDGLVVRLQAYEPFGPGGPVGLVLAGTRLARRVRRLMSGARSQRSPRGSDL